MTKLRTSKGFLTYHNQILSFNTKVMNTDVVLDNLRILSVFLDKIDINWGPAFGTLIGIVRNDEFQPWKPFFDLYILQEDEERFKDALWLLQDVGFQLVRYERRGRYYLERNQEYFKIFVLSKIGADIRHTGSIDFIHEKYLQNTVKWDFKGISLNVPEQVDEYLDFQYGLDWGVPKQTVFYNGSCITRGFNRLLTFIEDHLPDDLYYTWTYLRRKSDFEVFKEKCKKAGIQLPSDVELRSMQPRRHKRVLTVGVYDLLHKGHIELYRRAKGLGDYLIVAVQDSDFILKYKPDAKVLNSTEDRIYMIKSIRYVDEVITYTDVDQIIQEIDFDIFVTGPDQCHEGFQRAIRWCEEHGKNHIVLSRTIGVSSSELKEKIAQKTKR